MASGKQNRDFEDSVLEDVKLLDKAIAWIEANMQPDAVFDAEKLNACVANISEPDDVFGVDALEAWAEANGFVKIAP